MARYIDADALKENLNEIARHSFTLDDGYQYFIKGLIRADDAINEIPTADVVEVVRCKHCLHYENGFCYNPNTYDDEKTRGNTTPSWFCADGERGKEDRLVMPPADGSTIKVDGERGTDDANKID